MEAPPPATPLVCGSRPFHAFPAACRAAFPLAVPLASVTVPTQPYLPRAPRAAHIAPYILRGQHRPKSGAIAGPDAASRGAVSPFCLGTVHTPPARGGICAPSPLFARRSSAPAPSPGQLRVGGDRPA